MIGKQLSIPELKSHMAQTRAAVGWSGEQFVARALQARGYEVSTSHVKGDLMVYDANGVVYYVEVKTARKNSQGVYQFCLWKHWQGRQCADHRNADFVVLVCVLKTGDAILFVIPVSDIGSRHTLAITSYPTKYTGWLAKYRQSVRKLTL